MASATCVLPPALTPDRLLAAAERLVLREGVHALSVRRIAAEAEANPALIRYHFGGSDGLLRDLALRNTARLADERLRLLDAAGPAPSFDAALDALVLPLWAPAAMTPGARAIAVLDEVYSRAAPAMRDEIWALFAPGVARVEAALAAHLPATPRETLTWRIRFVTAAALDIPPRNAAGETAATPPATRLAAFRAFAAHALRDAD